MSDERERTEQQPEAPEQSPSVEGPARVGIAVSELGQPRRDVFLPDGRESVPLSEMISGGLISGGSDLQYFVNYRQADMSTEVKDGDAVVVVRKITAG